MRKNKSRKKKFLKHISKVAIEPEQVLATEGAKVVIKEVFNSSLKVARAKPAMAVAKGIVSAVYVPVAGSCASPALCIACDILTAKTVG